MGGAALWLASCRVRSSGLPARRASSESPSSTAPLHLRRGHARSDRLRRRRGDVDAGQAGEYLKESAYRWLIRAELTGRSRRGGARDPRKGADRLDGARRAAGASWRSEALSACCSGHQRPGRDAACDERFERLPAFVPLLAPTADFRRTANLRLGGGHRTCSRSGRAVAPVPRAADGERDDPPVKNTLSTQMAERLWSTALRAQLAVRLRVGLGQRANRGLETFWPSRTPRGVSTHWGQPIGVRPQRCG